MIIRDGIILMRDDIMITRDEILTTRDTRANRSLHNKTLISTIRSEVFNWSASRLLQLSTSNCEHPISAVEGVIFEKVGVEKNL